MSGQSLLTLGDFNPTDLKFKSTSGGDVAFFRMNTNNYICVRPSEEYLSKAYVETVAGFVVIRNKCQHKSGMFLRDIEDLGPSQCQVTCSQHGWKLNLCDMMYTNPQGPKQPTLHLEELDSGYIRVYDLAPEAPWGELREPEVVKKGEFTLEYFCHACVCITMGNFKLFTDPWLTGPAFGLGWWLLHKPKDSWLDELSKASAIYISHQHSDHLNIPTLKILAGKNDSIKILVPDFGNSRLTSLLRSAAHEVNVVLVYLILEIQISFDYMQYQVKIKFFSPH